MNTPNNKRHSSRPQRILKNLWLALARRARWLLKSQDADGEHTPGTTGGHRLPNPATAFRARNRRRRATALTHEPTLSLPLTVLAWVVPILVAAAAFTSPLIGARAYEYLLESEHFFVRDVVVDGHQRLDPKTIQGLAGIDGQTNIIAADLDMMSERLLMHPWIASVQIHRELPDRLFIKVAEEVPHGCILLDEVYVVNGLGHPFTLADPRQPLDFPLITGLQLDAFADEARAADARARLRAAINLHRLYEHLQMGTRWPLSEIRLEADRAMSLVLSDVGTEAVLGSDGYRDKLYRLEWVLESLHQQGKVADYVLLDDPQQINNSIDTGRVIVRANIAPTSDEIAERARTRAEKAIRHFETKHAATSEALDHAAVEGASTISDMVRPAIEGRWVDDQELREMDDAQSTNHGE